jgi:IstB-like ATP binding protein
MLTHPTYDRLLELGLTGMAKALEEQRRQRNVEGLSFEERLGLLVDREVVERESKRLISRLNEQLRSQSNRHWARDGNQRASTNR